MREDLCGFAISIRGEMHLVVGQEVFGVGLELVEQVNDPISALRGGLTKNRHIIGQPFVGPGGIGQGWREFFEFARGDEHDPRTGLVEHVEQGV